MCILVYIRAADAIFQQGPILRVRLFYIVNIFYVITYKNKSSCSLLASSQERDNE
jgi:hypothetical protein